MLPNLRRRYRRGRRGPQRAELEQLPRPARRARRATARGCGPRASPCASRAARIAEHVGAAGRARRCAFFDALELDRRARRSIAGRILKEIRERLRFLDDVGLGYLTLDRAPRRCRAARRQRIRLATQIGSRLTGVLYILDEPSIGLHQRDNRRLLDTLRAPARPRQHRRRRRARRGDDPRRRLRRRPRARAPASTAARSSFAGHARRSSPTQPTSLTGAYLSRRASDRDARRAPRAGQRQRSRVVGARASNNLQGHRRRVPARPAHRASPASPAPASRTLVNDILLPRARARRSTAPSAEPGAHDARSRASSSVDKVIDIDQSPIGRTPRSQPGHLHRALHAHPRALRRAARGHARAATSRAASRFNVKGGRCEACEGDGVHRDRDALPARRLRPLRGVRRPALQPRDARGPLPGQVDRRRARHDRRRGAAASSSTSRRSPTSCGRSQRRRPRLPHARPAGHDALRRRGAAHQAGARSCRSAPPARTLYILDEPTTGPALRRHPASCSTCSTGWSSRATRCVVIEHNLDVIKTADWVIDLGPEGGAAAARSWPRARPRRWPSVKASHTGQFLADRR